MPFDYFVLQGWVVQTLSRVSDYSLTNH